MIVGAGFLMAASLVLPWVAGRWTNSDDPVWPYLVVVVALNIVSLVNAMDGPLPGAQWDARSFHDLAALSLKDGVWPELSIGTELYVYVLAGAYRVTDSHILIGQSLSVLTGTAALVVIGVLTRMLGIERKWVRSLVILVVGLSPVFLFHNALTFREPYQMLGLAVGAVFTVKACLTASPRWLIPAAGGFLFMGLFHHVLLGMSLVLAAAAVFFVLFSTRRPLRQRVQITALVAAGLALGAYLVTVVPVTSGNDYVGKLQREGGLVDAVIAYRQTIESKNPRTSFDSVDAGAGSGGTIVAFGKNYVQYLFKPYATDMEIMLDWVPFLCSLLRLVCVLVVLWLLIRQRLGISHSFVLLTYLAVTVVWSIGTTNYGQAFRHHATTDWLLVLLLGYAVHLFIESRTGNYETDSLPKENSR